MMKKMKSTSNMILQAIMFTTILSSFVACNSNSSKDDAKVVAEEHNEAKYDNTSKEKDAQFLVNVAESNLKEIKLSTDAQKNGSVKIVKQLATFIKDAHELSMNELTAFAQSKQITIPIVATTMVDDAEKTLMAKKGKEYDKAYCEMMVAGHKKAIDLFEFATKNSNDIDIKNYAIAGLPNLRMHLDSALNCQRMCEEMK
jgi:putative membrane protein